jgi:hypothetical protein
MAQKPEYKFKPYSPKNLKLASAGTAEDKTLKSLEAQRANLDARLRAEGIDPETLGGEFDNRNFLEKALNLRPNQGLLLDFFEVINRPVEAVKAGFMAGVEGRDVISNALDGLSGEQITPGREVFTQITGFKPESGVGKFATDIAVDIFLDPLTYLPAGFFTKRIGKMFSKSKTIVTKEFVQEGLEALGKAGLRGADGLAFKSWDDLTRHIDSLDEVARKKAIETIEATIDAPGNKNIFRKGAKEDYGTGKYTYSYEGLQERRRILKETNDEILRIRREVTDPKKANQQIEQLLTDKGLNKASRTSLDNNVLAEIKLADELDPMVRDLGSDYGTMVTRTSNRLDDVSIVKTIKIGDNEYVVKLVSFDTKIGEGAYGVTKNLSIKGGKVQFTVDDLGGVAKLEDLRKIKVNYTAADGTKITNMYDAVQELGKKEEFIKTTTNAKGKVVTKANKSFNPYDLLDKAGANYAKEKAALDQFFKAMNYAKFDNGRGIIFLADIGPNGKGIYARFEDVADYLDYSKSSFQISASGAKKAEYTVDTILTAGGKVRANALKNMKNAGLDFTGIIDDAGNVLDASKLEDLVNQYNKTIGGTKRSEFRMMGRIGMDDANYEKFIANTPSNKIITPENLIESLMTETGTKTFKISFLDFLEDKSGFIGDLARVTNKAIKYLKSKFSLYGFIPDEVETAIRRMSGETAVQFQTRMRRLAALQDSFEKAFPGQSATLAQLVELGASLDEAGQIVFAPRNIGLQDYFHHMLESSDTGKPYQLRRFASQQHENAFLRTLEDVTGNQNSFKIVTKKNGAKVLETNLSVDELREALEIIKIDSRYQSLILDFGKMNPTPQQLKIIKEWGGYNEFVSLKNDVQKMLVDEGGFTEFLGAAYNDTYIRHILTKDGYEWMMKQQPGVISKYAKPGSNVFAKRQYLGTIDEVNEYLRAIYDLDLDVIDNNVWRASEDFFTKAFKNIEQGRMVDILLSSKDKTGRSLMRVVDNTRDIRTSMGPDDIMFKSFNEEFKALYENLSEEAQEGLTRYLTKNGFGKDKAIVMNRSMHSVLKRVEGAYIDLPAWVKVYDKYLNTWKGLTLITPGFHMRNLFGNSFNSYAVGMGLPAQMRYARIASLEFDEYAKAARILAEGGTLTARQQKIYEIMSEFQRSGLIQSHRGVRDLEQVKEMTEEALKKGGKGVKTSYNNLVRLNFNFAEKMDDMQRYMLWRWSYDKTGDAVQASKTVAKSLFDYSNLTGFEKDVMKRLFPFYTFMKNNFIFQAKNIFANPGAYARAGRAYKYYLEDISGYSMEDLPDYATENMWIPLPMMITKNDKEGIAFLKANLPISDFVELVENPFKKGVISVTVPVKLAIEIGAGRDLFTGAPITEFPGQTNLMEPGTGVLSGIRDSRGSLAIAQTPLMQKILNDLGLRTPFNVASIGLDVADTLLGYQGPSQGFGDFLQRAGVAGVQEKSKLELTQLYQDLEHLRELKKYYEQQTGNQLPVLPRG